MNFVFGLIEFDTYTRTGFWESGRWFYGPQWLEALPYKTKKYVENFDNNYNLLMIAFLLFYTTNKI